ncbi:MAG: glycosyltransferase family 4 protein, partial [Verrucomicrobiota bacterium]
AAVTAPYPNLLTIHGIPHLSNFAQKVSRFSRSRIVEITGNRCLQTARNLVIINPFVTEQLHLTPASHRLFSIPNPVAPQFFTAPTPAREPNLVLAIGWVDRLKAHDVFIRALALLKRRGHTVRAMIVGAIPKSDYAAALQQYVRTEQLAVEFIGFIPPEQVADLLRRCTVLVHPSRHENAPMSICEAMTCRTPVIAARVGGVPYLIRDGVSGLLFQSGNASELADKLQDLLENPATRDRLGAAAHLAAAQAHHPDVVAKLTRAAYATVLQSNSPKETHVRD